MPDHLHAVWTLPDGDSGFFVALGDDQAAIFVAAAGRRISIGLAGSKTRTGIWQRRFWDHLIRDEDDFRAHVDYVHYNPMKHGLVSHPADWPYSTFHRAVARGEAPAQWAASCADDGNFGERTRA